jgi:hypothetical protein
MDSGPYASRYMDVSYYSRVLNPWHRSWVHPLGKKEEE